MARDRYLVGVTEQDLQKAEELRPKTFKEKTANFWYHYKWVVLGIVLIAVIAVVLFTQLFTRKTADYTVCVVTKQELSRQAVEHLEREFAACGKDLNGDGKVMVTVEIINIGGAVGSQQYNTSHATLQGRLMSDDVYIFVMDPTYYEKTLAPNVAEGQTFFMPIGIEVAGISKDGTYWNWNDSALLAEEAMQENEVWQAVPSDMYVGVRNMANADRDVIAAQRELLQRFISKSVRE